MIFIDQFIVPTIKFGKCFAEFMIPIALLKMQAYMHVLDACKNKEDPIENDGARVFIRFLPLTVYKSIRAANSAVHGLIWSNFKLDRDFMADPMKNEGARVFTVLYINFSDAQGQITLELLVVCGRNLKSSKLLCMPLLPARMRMIKSKMKELECSQDFSHYKSMGIFQTLRAANSAVLGPIWSNFELV